MTNPYVATGKTAGTPFGEKEGGRFLTFLESELIHPSHTDGFVERGDPVVAYLGDKAIVGVALKSASAATDLVTIDTEGIWWQTMTAENDDGNVGVYAGDRVFINLSTCVLSLTQNDNTHQEFGYALGTLSSGTSGIVAVKVHGDAADFRRIVVGTSASPISTAVAGFKRWELRAKTTATSGDGRAAYVSMEFAGAGVSGEAIRARSIVSAAVAGGVHGLHGGVEIATAGSVTGLAAGVRGTLIGKNASVGGTVCGGMSELWADGASTDWAGGTHSIHRFVNAGDGTGKATAKNVFEFVGLSSTQFVAATNSVIDHALQVLIDGVTYWIGLYDAKT
jgi:hypothetical protein